MPTSDDILAELTVLAQEWRLLAIFWHVWIGTFVVLLLSGWRPPAPLLARLLIPPLASVALLAALAGNPFNAVFFTSLTVVLLAAAALIPNTAVRVASRPAAVAGAALIVFGWTYWHFIGGQPWTTYLFAAPLGVVPCPTLSVAIGATLVFENYRWHGWSAALALAGILYGAVGLFSLGVVIDAVLLSGALILAAVWLREAGAWRSVRAERSEHARRLPGDDLIPSAGGSFTHAVTIAARPSDLWPWLVQMGASPRAGWYSYDLLDNGRRPSATRLIPELQHVSVGDVFPALPGVTDGFKVLAVEPVRSLVLGWTEPDGTPAATWTFVLEKCDSNSTRLIVRARGGPNYRLHGLPPSLSGPIIRCVHFIMQRRQLLGLARRAEAAGPLFSRSVVSP